MSGGDEVGYHRDVGKYEFGNEQICDVESVFVDCCLKLVLRNRRVWHKVVGEVANEATCTMLAIFYHSGLGRYVYPIQRSSKA